MKNLKQYTFAVLCAIAIISCEKEENTINNTNINEQEDSQAIVHSEIIFTKNYDNNLSKEEKNTLFKKDVAAYISTQKKSKNRSAYTEWYTHIIEDTGSDLQDATNGDVQFKAYYDTNIGKINTTNWTDLPLKQGFVYRNANYSAYHLIRTSINARLNWIDAFDMEVRLEGGDDWLLRNLFMEVNSKHQDDDVYAYGFSYTAQEEYNTHKLDPGCNSCTDQYFVKDVVTITRYGRMHFD